MVSGKTAPPDVHALIPGTCAEGNLTCRRDLAHVIELRCGGGVVVAWIIQVGPIEPCDALKAEQLPSCGGKRVGTKKQGHRDAEWLAQKMEEGLTRQGMASRRWTRQGNGFSPGASGDEGAPADTSVLAW